MTPRMEIPDVGEKCAVCGGIMLPATAAEHVAHVRGYNMCVADILSWLRRMHPAAHTLIRSIDCGHFVPEARR
jgi:hypothetical protein